jgi:hypothetical protein
MEARTSFRIPKELKRQLALYAKREGLSISAVVRDALRIELNRFRPEQEALDSRLAQSKPRVRNTVLGEP